MRVFNYKRSKESFRFSANQLIAVARKLYNRIPIRLQWIASPFIYFYRFCRLLPKLRLKLWILTGDGRSGHMPLSILHATNDRNPNNIRTLNYLLRLTFGDSFQERYLYTAWLWKISSVMAKRKKDCSLVIVQVRKSHRKLMRSNDWFYIPDWVIGEVDIPLDTKVLNKHTLKSDFKKIRKHSLQFEVTQDPQSFDDFYYNMYMPYIAKAHSASAFIEPYEKMRAEFKNCDLLLITKQAKRTAGLVIVYERTGPRLWVSGIRDGNPEYLKDGVVGALYHFSLRYLEDKGFTKVQLGKSRAFLRDGVLRYKSKWSQRIVGTSNNGFALKVISCSEALKTFLQQNPFIFEKNGLLHSAVFVDTKKPLSAIKLRQIEKFYFTPGLSNLFIYHLRHCNPIKQDNATPELFDQIIFCSIEDVI